MFFDYTDEVVKRKRLLFCPLQNWRNFDYIFEYFDRRKEEGGNEMKWNEIHWIDSTSHWLSYDIKDHRFDIWLVFSLSLPLPLLFFLFSLSSLSISLSLSLSSPLLISAFYLSTNFFLSLSTSNITFLITQLLPQPPLFFLLFTPTTHNTHHPFTSFNTDMGFNCLFHSSKLESLIDYVLFG